MTVFAIILAVIYLMAGVAKLAGAKPMAEQFAEFDLSLSAMRVVGALEVAAAVGLFIDSLETWAAEGMVLMMVGAIYYHRRAGHPVQQSIPAAVVLVLSAVYIALSLSG